jgi:hypothetical protein
MPLPLAALVAVANPSWWAIVPAALAVRAAAAYAVSRGVLGVTVNWGLLIVEDIAAFCSWIAGFFGSTITWRGRRYRLRPDGRFEPLTR